MSTMEIILITIAFSLIGIFLGLLISKFEHKNISWKQLLLIKFKVMIIIPFINLLSKSINKKRKK